MVATASRVGTGNIAGIATALVAGGPGALMWMWIMAIIGGASAFAESTLAQIYKERDGAIFKGGPAYYIEKAMGMRWLGLVFATILIITFAYGFNGLQSYNIVSAFEYYSSDWENSSVPVYLGIVLAVISMVLFFGGVDKISKVSSILVPIMAGLYIFLGIVVVLFNIEKFPEVISMIVTDAFDFRAIFGGMLGSCLVMGSSAGCSPTKLVWVRRKPQRLPQMSAILSSRGWCRCSRFSSTPSSSARPVVSSCSSPASTKKAASSTGSRSCRLLLKPFSVPWACIS